MVIVSGLIVSTVPRNRTIFPAGACANAVADRASDNPRAINIGRTCNILHSSFVLLWRRDRYHGSVTKQSLPSRAKAYGPAPALRCSAIVRRCIAVVVAAAGSLLPCPSEFG